MAMTGWCSAAAPICWSETSRSTAPSSGSSRTVFRTVPGAEAGRPIPDRSRSELGRFRRVDGGPGAGRRRGDEAASQARPVRRRLRTFGAYCKEIDQTLVEVELIDEATGETHVVPAGDLGLGPRTSDLKRHYGSEPRRRAVILFAITLELDDVGTGAFPESGPAHRQGDRCGCRCRGHARRCARIGAGDPGVEGHGARPR